MPLAMLVLEPRPVNRLVGGLVLAIARYLSTARRITTY